MHAESCFEEDQLRQYAMGLLDDESSDQIERHLAACETCDSAITAVEGSGDSLVRSLRLRPQQTEAPSWVDRLATHAEPESLAPVEETEEVQTDPMVIGDYRLQRVLGRGGMSVVFEAKHLRLNSDVAFKVLKQPASAGRQAVERFCREMKSVGSLSHPAIVQATDAGEHDGVHYLVMEKIDGVDLSRLLYQTGPLPIGDACRIVCDLADALSHAHEAGIVHRDIKPSNVMLDRTGRVKLLDFGLARFTSAPGEVTEATTVGQLLGTLDYMAPEQANGDAVDARADVYSLGATLFRLLTGRPPHGRSAETPLLEFVKRIASEETLPIHELRTDVPDELADIVQQSLTRDTADRTSSADELRKQLQSFATEADLKALIAEHPTVATRDESPSVNSELFGLMREVFPGQRISSEPTPVTASKQGSTSRWWLAAVATVILAPLIYFGVTILLKTPNGTVRIDSEVDDVRVELLDEKDAVTKLMVDRKGEATEIRAGRPVPVPLRSSSQRLQRDLPKTHRRIDKALAHRLPVCWPFRLLVHRHANQAGAESASGQRRSRLVWADPRHERRVEQSHAA